MLTEELSIYRDTCELANKLLSYNNNINRNVRFSVYSECINKAFDACDAIYCANKYKERRASYLDRFLILVGGVRTRIRVLHEQKYLDVHKATHLQFLIDKICKEANGWKKTILNTQP